MATITLKGEVIHTVGDLPQVNSAAPNFNLTKLDFSEFNLQDVWGRRVILNLFPSVDTPVCASSVRFFNSEVSRLTNTVVLCVSADLPYAQARFCGAEGLNQVVMLSDFRHKEFGEIYGARIKDSVIAGLLSRAVIIINELGKVIYTEQVPEIAQEPDYLKALAMLKGM